MRDRLPCHCVNWHPPYAPSRTCPERSQTRVIMGEKCRYTSVDPEVVPDGIAGARAYCSAAGGRRAQQTPAFLVRVLVLRRRADDRPCVNNRVVVQRQARHDSRAV